MGSFKESNSRRRSMAKSWLPLGAQINSGRLKIAWISIFFFVDPCHNTRLHPSINLSTIFVSRSLLTIKFSLVFVWILELSVGWNGTFLDERGLVRVSITGNLLHSAQIHALLTRLGSALLYGSLRIYSS